MLPDAQLTSAALAVLPSEAAPGGAEALIEVAQRCDLRRVDELLAGWLRATKRSD